MNLAQTSRKDCGIEATIKKNTQQTEKKKKEIFQ